MPSTTISPQARIVALVGVLLIALGGSAFFVLRGHHTQTASTTPPAHHPKPSQHVHVVRPNVNPLLPTPLRNALERHPIVVAAFFYPHSPAGGRTIMEARAGAVAANAGFISVNLLDDSVAGPLTALLPAGQILPNPGFVIVSRPGTIVYRSDGYIARALVAQAVKDSR